MESSEECRSVAAPLHPSHHQGPPLIFQAFPFWPVLARLKLIRSALDGLDLRRKATIEDIRRLRRTYLPNWYAHRSQHTDLDGLTHKPGQWTSCLGNKLSLVHVHHNQLWQSQRCRYMMSVPSRWLQPAVASVTAAYAVHARLSLSAPVDLLNSAKIDRKGKWSEEACNIVRQGSKILATMSQRNDSSPHND